VSELQISCVYVRLFSYQAEFTTVNYSDSSDHICRL